VAELVDVIQAQQLNLNSSELEARRREKRKQEFEEIFKWAAAQEWKKLAGSDGTVKKQLDEVVKGLKDPYTALKEIFPDGFIKRYERTPS